ncbi:mitochondrial escape protein 2 [Irineochytrium annulatum]|nr:mitochondrial escape protein 2 [Irineochytrium annulatum]
MRPIACQPSLLSRLNSTATPIVTDIATENGSATNTTAPVPTETPKGPIYQIWFEAIFPVKLTRWDPRHFFIKRYAASMKKQARLSLIPPAENFKTDFHYISSDAMVKEGGVLLKFTTTGDPAKVFKTIQDHIEDKNLRSAFSLSRIGAFLVRGHPFVEDLQSSIPSNRIKIEFKGAPLSVEDVFNAARTYGKIDDISISGNIANVQYMRIRSATAARNCLHGAIIEPTDGGAMATLSISYEKALMRNAIFNFIKGAGMISIPIIIALLTAITLVIFDPLRIFFITNEVTQRFSVTKLYKRYIEHIREYFYGKYFTPAEIAGSNEAMPELEQMGMKIKSLLRESPGSILLVTGPDGAGQSKFVTKTTKGARFKVHIDLSKLVDEPDHSMLNRLASQIGYFPVFGFFVAVSGYIDTIISATTGAKANLASSNAEQAKKMLETLTIALHQITSAQRAARDAAILRQKEMLENGTESSAADHKHTVVPEVDYPVVVIDYFLSKENGRQKILYDLMTEWAAIVSQHRIAHIVFMSDHPSAVKVIEKSIPKKTVEVFTMADAPVDSAVAYVEKRLGLVMTPRELGQAIERIGGRQSDLETFISKIQAGSKGNASLPEVVTTAFHDMVSRSVTEVRKVGLGEGGPLPSDWTPVQFWKLIQLLSSQDSIPYEGLMYHPLFKGDNKPLHALERTGMISVSLHNGRPHAISVGRPILRSAFAQILADERYAAMMGVETCKELRGMEEAKIQKLEGEMATLSQSMAMARDLVARRTLTKMESRLDYLANAVYESQKKVGEREAEEAKFKKVLRLD